MPIYALIMSIVAASVVGATLAIIGLRARKGRQTPTTAFSVPLVVAVVLAVFAPLTTAMSGEIVSGPAEAAPGWNIYRGVVTDIAPGDVGISKGVLSTGRSFLFSEDNPVVVGEEIVVACGYEYSPSGSYSCVPGDATVSWTLPATGLTNWQWATWLMLLFGGVTASIVATSFLHWKLGKTGLISPEYSGLPGVWTRR